MELRMMTLEGILSIQAGDNPRLVSEKLMSYVPPAERTSGEEQNVAQLNVEAKAACSGNILPGGKAVAQQGATDNSAQVPSSVELQAIEPVKTEGSSSLQN